jgi:hypothetical protein
VRLWLCPPAGSTLGARVRATLAFGLPALAGSAPSWAAQPLGLSTAKESKAYAFVALDIYADPKDRLSQTTQEDMESEFSSMTDVLTRDPRRVLSHYATDVYEDAVRVVADSVTLPAAFFVGLGFLLWFARGGADRRRACAYLVFPAVTFAIVALVPYQARYGYALVPAAAALVGAALVRRAGDRALDRFGAGVRRLCLVLAFLPPLAMTAIKLREYLTTEPRELLAGGEALRPLVRPGDRMLARKAHLPHLAGAVPVFPRPHDDLDAFLAWARREAKARFLLVGDWEVRTVGALRPLLDGEPPAGLRRVWRHESPRHVVYEILPK